METSKITSEHKHPSLALANILFATWLSSLLWGGGIFFSALAFFGAIVAGLLSFFGPPIWNATMIIALILGLAATYTSSIFLWRIITHDQQQSANIGFVSFLASTSIFLLTWIGIGAFSEWAHHNWSSYFGNSFLFLRTIDDIGPILIIGFTTCATIVSGLIKTYHYQYRELIASAVIGIGISIIDGIILEKTLLKNNEIFHLTWQIPSLVWVSVVYFAELLAGRSKWKDFFVWAILVLISFGLPFIVVFLLSVD